MFELKGNNSINSSFFDHIVGVPQDGIVTNTTQAIHVATTATFVLLATAGIIFALFCFFFNCYFRDKK